MPNAPSDGATIPLYPLLGWSFPSLSMKNSTNSWVGFPADFQ
ncbi:MAG: hypothetical protein V7K81_26735 [Nostoc sp.]